MNLQAVSSTNSDGCGDVSTEAQTHFTEVKAKKGARWADMVDDDDDVPDPGAEVLAVSDHGWSQFVVPV